MKTIQRIIEIPIEELQNEDAKENWANYNENQCCLCGKKSREKPEIRSLSEQRKYCELQRRRHRRKSRNVPSRVGVCEKVNHSICFLIWEQQNEIVIIAESHISPTIAI